MPDVNYTEAAWSRGWSDAKTCWSDWRFLFMDVIVVPIISLLAGLSPISTLIVMVALMLGIVIGTTVSAPVKQRNEAREMLLKIKREAQQSIDGLQNQITELKTPKLSILFDPNDDNCIEPIFIDVHRTKDGKVDGRSEIRQVNVYVNNESIVAPIDRMEIYCTDMYVLVDQPAVYDLFVGEGGYVPRCLEGGENLPCVILKEIVYENEEHAVTKKRIETIVASKLRRKTFQGKEFAITLTAYGSPSPPRTETYRFGERDGQFFFEPYSRP